MQKWRVVCFCLHVCSPSFAIELQYPFRFATELCQLVIFQNFPWSANVVYDIVRLILLTKGSGIPIGMAWIPGHSGIQSNVIGHYIRRSVVGLPFYIHQSLPRNDILQVSQRDFESWVCQLKPYDQGRSRDNRYFTQVNYKTIMPQFAGVQLPRGFINLIRLESAHIFTDEHFSRMRQNLDLGCGCGAALKDLQHLFHTCFLVSEGRPKFYSFLVRRFPHVPPERVEYVCLTFVSEVEVVREMSTFFRSGSS